MGFTVSEKPTEKSNHSNIFSTSKTLDLETVTFLLSKAMFRA